MVTPPVSGDEAARLLVEADSFLRLGLVEKAIAHLADALRRDPSLRALREPLIKMYVSQRLYQSAIGELWSLLAQSESPQEEIRLLRYILRLGKDPIAVQRLKVALERHQATLSQTREDAATRLSLSSAVDELRTYIGKHPPATDLARTMDLSADELKRLNREHMGSRLITVQNRTEIEAVAQEIAVDGDLQEALAEFDGCLTRQQYDEAQKLLDALAGSHPHSPQVRARMKQLFQAQAGQTAERRAVTSGSDPGTRRVDFHSAPTMPPWAGLSAPQILSDVPTEPAVQERLESVPIELTTADLSEATETPPTAKTPRQPPPPPPSAISLPQGSPVSEAESALRTGAKLRSFGQHAQAIVMLEKARDDATCGAMAMLMAGLSYRELGRPEEAITAFMHGVNHPEASDADVSRMFYELGSTHEQLGSPESAILYYQLSLGVAGSYFDAAERIAALQSRLRPTT